jgi:hypothetical protein
MHSSLRLRVLMRLPLLVRWSATLLSIATPLECFPESFARNVSLTFRERVELATEDARMACTLVLDDGPHSLISGVCAGARVRLVPTGHPPVDPTQILSVSTRVSSFFWRIYQRH